jgi:hypothetical protein
MTIYIYDDNWDPMLNTKMAFSARAILEIGKKNEILKNRMGSLGPLVDPNGIRMLLDLLVENNIITDEAKARYLLLK